MLALDLQEEMKKRVLTTQRRFEELEVLLSNLDEEVQSGMTQSAVTDFLLTVQRHLGLMRVGESIEPVFDDDEVSAAKLKTESLRKVTEAVLLPYLALN
jgi:hypothetical protein